MVYDRSMMWQNIRMKNRTKHQLNRRRLVLAAVAVLVSFTALPLQAFADSLNEGTREQQRQARYELPIESNEIRDWPEGPETAAQAAIVMEAGTGTILYAKNIHETLYPASTTKILTCMLAAENCAMDEVVTFSYEAVSSVPSDGSNAGIDAGQQLSMEDCLKCILIISANEVANGVAEHISGSETLFVQKMNERAKELGCVDSHFANTNGLHDENHYTSAYDLALIAREFFKNELLAKIAGMRQVHLLPTEKQPDEIWANTTNRITKNEIPYEYYVGGKTGYTDQAHSTLVSCAEKDGMKLICVVLKEDSPEQYEDTITLFEYGFNNFQKVNIANNETKYTMEGASFFSGTNDVLGNSRPIMELNEQDYVVLPSTAQLSDTTSTLSYEVEDPDKLAEIVYDFHGIRVGETSIDFVKDAKPSYEFDSQLVSNLSTYTTGEREDGRIIFINVKKVILWILIAVGVVLIIMASHSVLENYQFFSFEKKRRRSRRRRRTSRRYHGRNSDVDF